MCDCVCVTVCAVRLSPDIPESVEVVEGVGDEVALLLDFDP